MSDKSIFKEILKVKKKNLTPSLILAVKTLNIGLSPFQQLAGQVNLKLGFHCPCYEKVEILIKQIISVEMTAGVLSLTFNLA